MALGALPAGHLAASGPQAPVPGQVLSFTKISNTAAGIPLALRNGDQFGRSARAIGDLNGDGISELAVGAQSDDDGGTLGIDSEVGAVWILFMNANGTIYDHQKISATKGNFTGVLDHNDQFGRAVAALGDIDGDGIPDIAVGAAKDSDGGYRRGAVWILRLNANGTVKSHQKISDTEGNFTAGLSDADQFGRAIISLGDLDGDGIRDIAVGAPLDDDGGFQHGAFYVLFLNADATVKSHVKINELQGGFNQPLDDWDSFGFSFANLGDLDGDGVVDIATGVPKDGDGGYRHGAFYILFLNSNGTVKAHQKISETQGGFGGNLLNTDEFGTSLANLGDLNGDGVIDLAVGSILDDEVGNDHGAVYILFLRPDGTVLDETKINEANGNFGGDLDDHDWFGSAVGGLGDLNGDGIADLVVGSRFDDDGGGNRGAIYVLFLDGLPVTPPVPDFRPTIPAGPAPLEVAFDDLSWGGVTSWTWDFGDGAVSTLAEPTHPYASGGSYVVTLTVGGVGGQATASRAFSIAHPAPKSEFTASPTGGVAPLEVAFTDLSTGPISAWSWDFGDGTVSTLAEPQHLYTQPGTYSVQLAVSGPGGLDVFAQTDYIAVAIPAPSVDFCGLNTNGYEPLVVDFTDLSTGDVSSWNWDFGDGSSSTEQHPSHTFVAAGAYSITLTATGPGGVGQFTRDNYVLTFVSPPVAEFSIAADKGLAPVTVDFTDASTGSITAWSWDFGDGGTSTEAEPTHVFTVAGTYSPSLTVTGPGGFDSFVLVDGLTVGEEPPTAAFAADLTAGTAPLPVSFTDETTGVVTAWSWDFGDGVTSTLANPTHTYTTPGTFTVALTAFGPTGDDTVTSIDFMQVDEAPPVALASVDLNAGFAPLAVQFSDASTGTITAWSWDFGDGASSSFQHPSHTYTTPGTFTVSLMVTGPLGNDTFVQTDWIAANDPVPLAAFDSDLREGFPGALVSFSDLSSGDVTSWSWTFGDGGVSSAAAPSHTYATVGSFDVSLTVSGPSGVDTVTALAWIEIEDATPVASFSAAPVSGSDPLTVVFSDLSSGDLSAWSWDFGDGAVSSEGSPSHVYTTPGTYSVTLAVTGPSGFDSLTQTDLVTVDPGAPTAAFGGSPLTGFAPLNVTFSDLSTGTITAWSWDFGDGASSSAAEPSHAYATPGEFGVTLTVTGPLGSSMHIASAYVTVEEAAPSAAFSAATTSGAAPLTVGFSDLSTGDVTAWSWNFGDGASSSEQHPSHTYLLDGTYTVSLMASGPAGSDLAVQNDLVTVTPEPPVAAFDALPTAGRAPLAVAFTDASTGVVTTWSWSFGDGGSSTQQNPLYTYTTPGTYTAVLTVTGPGGLDVEALFDLVEVDVPLGLQDPSFEAQTPAGPPAPPWQILSGTNVILPDFVVEDNGMPSAGGQWLEVLANGTNGATPPSNPGGLGSAPVGGAGVAQAFQFPPESPVIRFDAAFLRNGPPDQVFANDWMSVDISDGVETYNLYYRDTFSPTLFTSNHCGLEMTKVETISTDLSELFPLADETTNLTVSIQVGNGGDAALPSRGYVDNFRFQESSRAAVYGCGTNPVGSLVHVSGLPSLGETIQVGLDNPLGTQAAPSIPALIFSLGPDPNFPCGTLLPGFGMNGPGELLINLAKRVSDIRIGPLWVGPGTPSVMSFGIPNDASLVGVTIYAQGILFDPSAAFGVKFGFTDAIELFVGS